MNAVNEQRCVWAAGSELERQYHDTEWGVPQRQPQRLFEMLILEGMQAGLSWRTVLNKREGYRELTGDFDAELMAGFTAADVQRLQMDIRVIRSRSKCQALVTNAQAWLRLADDCGDPVAWLWAVVDGRPKLNAWADVQSVPASTAESERLAQRLRERGFSFVGPVICYAFMQAVGMVNDHGRHCFRREQIAAMATQE